MFKQKLRINQSFWISCYKRPRHFRTFSNLFLVKSRKNDSSITRANRAEFSSSWQLVFRVEDARKLANAAGAQKCKAGVKLEGGVESRKPRERNRDKRQSVNVRQLQFASCVPHRSDFLAFNRCSNCSNEQRDKNGQAVSGRSCSELTTSRYGL